MNSDASQRTRANSHRPARARQRGVVLIMALIMLVVVSMLATMSIRSATSTEAVAGNVRTGGMAMQAAETALRFCEESLRGTLGSPAAAEPAVWKVMPRCPTATAACDPLKGTAPTEWDKSVTDAFAVPLTLVNTGTVVTFHRAPECMVEQVRMVNNLGVLTTTTYIITARGFGPEVAAADAGRTRPVGSEVWLQSTVEFN